MSRSVFLPIPNPEPDLRQLSIAFADTEIARIGTELDEIEDHLAACETHLDPNDYDESLFINAARERATRTRAQYRAACLKRDRELKPSP